MSACQPSADDCCVKNYRASPKGYFRCFVFLLLVEMRVQNGVSCHFGQMFFQRSASPKRHCDLSEHAFRLVPSFCYVAT